MDPNVLAIYAIGQKSNRQQITDLYWFEENYVHDFGGKGVCDSFTFEIFVNNIRVYPPVYNDGLSE